MNTKYLTFGLAGVFAGILLTFAIIYVSAQGIMIKEKQVNLSFVEADTLFRKTTIDKGWKLTTTHDLQATMKKFGKDVKSVNVYEICNMPAIAAQSKYPIALAMLKREGFIESDSDREKRLKSEFNDQMNKSMKEMEELMKNYDIDH